MVDHIVDASERHGRMDIRIGIGRRRRWSVEAKGRAVAESYAPGAVVSEVARRHEIAPQHLFAWRKAARSGRLALPVDAATPMFVPMFVPVVTAKGEPDAAGGIANRGSIVIEIGGALVRAEPGVDVVWLRDVLRAVKAAT
jgi:transposase